MNNNDEVTVTLKKNLSVAGLLVGNVDGDTLTIATRFGPIVRPRSDVRPSDPRFPLTPDARAAIVARWGNV